MVQHGTEGADRGGGPKAAAQQADTVELADPLTVLDIAFATRHVLDVPSRDRAGRRRNVRPRLQVDAGDIDLEALEDRR